MARNTTTRSKSQKSQRAQGKRTYYCPFCQKTSNLGQAIISHINGPSHDRQAVTRWMGRFPDTPAGKADRMLRLQDPTVRQLAKGPATETTGAASSAVSAGITAEAATNYWAMGRAQVSSEISELEENIRRAEEFLATARPQLEDKRRELQISDQLVSRATVPNGSYSATELTQGATKDEPRVMHA